METNYYLNGELLHTMFEDRIDPDKFADELEHLSAQPEAESQAGWIDYFTKNGMTNNACPMHAPYRGFTPDFMCFIRYLHEDYIEYLRRAQELYLSMGGNYEG